MRVIFSEAAKADIRAILLETREKFGPMQVPRYRALISEARQRLHQMPTLGHHREGMPPEARPFHISQPGRSASHFFLFRVDDTERRIEVVRVLHEAMDIPRHWSPPR